MTSGNALPVERRYDHSRLEPRRRVMRWLLQEVGFRFLVRIERVEGLENFPERGPAIVMINHIALVDPVVVLGSLPRNVVPMAKIEVYRLPVVGILPWLWRVIPVRRGEVDRRALHLATLVLQAGEVVLLAPEGTRHPRLQRGKEGVAYLGYRAGAPIVPTAIDGTPGFPTLPFTRRWRESGVRIRIGKPFRFRRLSGRPDRERLRQMTDEAMYALAWLLPEARRGVYADLDRATTETIEFV
jgi:1-acyl-sn-glycerol-3-phosphate acyltransferase